MTRSRAAAGTRKGIGRRGITVTRFGKRAAALLYLLVYLLFGFSQILKVAFHIGKSLLLLVDPPLLNLFVKTFLLHPA